MSNDWRNAFRGGAPLWVALAGLTGLGVLIGVMLCGCACKPAAPSLRYVPYPGHALLSDEGGYIVDACGHTVMRVAPLPGWDRHQPKEP